MSCFAFLFPSCPAVTTAAETVEVEEQVVDVPVEAAVAEETTAPGVVAEEVATSEETLATTEEVKEETPKTNKVLTVFKKLSPKNLFKRKTVIVTDEVPAVEATSEEAVEDAPKSL